MVELHFIEFSTRGRNEIVDLTAAIQDKLDHSHVTAGQALIFVSGSTAALSTLEYEPGLIQDLPLLLEKLIPQKHTYLHDETWHDGNGHSHLRATLIGPSLVVPIVQRRLLLGTWQQVVFLEFDNKPRQRRIAVQFLGESEKKSRERGPRDIQS